MPEKARGRNRRLAVLLGLALSAAILVGLGLRLDWPVFFEELRRIHLGYVPLLVVITLLTFWVRALRWRHLLPKGSEVSRLSLFEATLVGFTATFVLPLRVGEIIRPWVLSRWQPVRFSAGLASIVIERAFDALTLMVLLGITVGQLDTVPPLVSVGAKVMAILAIVVLAIMIAAYLGASQLISLGERLIMAMLGRRFPALAQKLVDMAEGFLEGLRGISSAKDLAWSIFWSLGLWALLVVLYQVGLWAFGLDASLWVGVTICVMIALAVAAPGAPGFVGTFQLGCVVALALFGYSEELGVAYSIVLHALQVITVVIYGFVILNRRGMQMRDIQKDAMER